MPAKSCSLYTIASEMTLEQIRSKLENADSEESIEVYGETYRLRTFISDLHWRDPEREVLSGVLSFETLQSVPQISGTPAYVKSGVTTTFSFFYGDDVLLYLAIFGNRRIAEKSATKMNAILTTGEDVPNQLVFNCRIPTTAIEQFLATHPHTKKMGGWKDLDFIGVDKGSLYGGNIDQFDQTSRYDAHGRKRYVMAELHDARMTIRISDEGIVTFYGDITEEDALAWIRREIIPLLT